MHHKAAVEQELSRRPFRRSPFLIPNCHTQNWTTMSHILTDQSQTSLAMRKDFLTQKRRENELGCLVNFFCPPHDAFEFYVYVV